MPSEPSPLESRIIELEMLYAHSQRLIEQLDEVLRDQQSRLAVLERRLLQMNDQVDRLAANQSENRTLEDDKPPHY